MPINVVERYGIDTSGTLDNSDKLAQLASDIALLHSRGGALPAIHFPEGEVLFDHWPNLAYPNIKIIADGTCTLHHTGEGNAIVFDGSLINPTPEPGQDFITFSGFNVLPSMRGGNGVVINACHRSRFDFHVFTGKLAGGDLHSAVAANFCVLTEIRPVVIGAAAHCIGLTLDAWPGRPALQSTACRVVQPILEGLEYGAFLKACGYATVYDGCIENCGTAIEIDDAGTNAFLRTEMEGNKTWDFVTTEKSKNNFLWYCGEGHPSKMKTNIRGWNNRVVHGPLDGLFGM